MGLINDIRQKKKKIGVIYKHKITINNTRHIYNTIIIHMKSKILHIQDTHNLRSRIIFNKNNIVNKKEYTKVSLLLTILCTFLLSCVAYPLMLNYIIVHYSVYALSYIKITFLYIS